MKHTPPSPPRILALSVSTRGIGYAVFEGPGELLEWGIHLIPSAEGKKRLARVRALLDWFAPDVLVVENHAGQGSRRGPRMRRQIDAIRQLGHRRRIQVRSYPRGTIRQCFVRYHAKGKDAIARVIAQSFPEMEHRLPKARRPWTPEDARMGIFDAASLALTHFYVTSARKL